MWTVYRRTARQIIRFYMLRSARRLALVFAGILITLFGCRSEQRLTWHEADGYRWAELGEFDGSRVGFSEVSPSRSGVRFVNTLEEESLLQNRHFMNGSGVALGDVDGDGRADIYFARLDGPNILYRNLGGWKFKDVTEEAGVAAHHRYSTGAVFADIDGDGDLDLLVTAMDGPNTVFLNDGRGRFTDVTEESGLSSDGGSTTMALADIDGDGDLDLFVGNYKARSINDVYPPWEHSFERTVVSTEDGYRIVPEFEEHYELTTHAGGLLRVERAETNRLYLNDGSGRFSEAPRSTFRDSDGELYERPPEDWTLTVRFQDVNGDGIPDLYVCNDFQSPDRFYLGDGRGGFRAIPELAVRKTSFSTMSVDFSDIDRDGHLDFFLTDMLSREHQRRQTQVRLSIPMPTAIGEIENRPQVVQNTLHLNRGDGTYAEIARMAGVAASDWTWSGLFLDVDLDGYEDLLLTTGHLYDVIDKDAQMREIQNANPLGDADAHRRLILDYPPLPLKNVAFRNNGDLSFDFMENGWGIGRNPDVSIGMAFGDLDNDGDLDVVVNRLNGPAGLFRNDADAPRIAVRLRGPSGNTHGIGSIIQVESPGLPRQEKEVVSGGIYLSGSDPVYSFAAAEPDAPIRVIVRWRDGQYSVLDSLRANWFVEIDHPGPQEETPPQRPDSTGVPTALFALRERSLHIHTDTPYDDEANQPLLKRHLSRLGPGVAWADLDGDGSDDLIVGTGKSGVVKAFRNDGSGAFSPWNGDLLDGPAAGDVAAIVTHPLPVGTRLFIAVSNHEGAPGDSSWIHIIDLAPSGRELSRQRLPFGLASVGALALVDVDGDDDLDLFAAARHIPGRYPDAAPSRLYVNFDGELRLDEDRSRAFKDVGMVSSAAFGDLDGDGDPDAVLAVDWGPIRYLENDGTGRYVDRTAEVGLCDFVGWWNGVTLGDFDGDGRLDIAATNWGWNSEYERLHRADSPVRLYYGDFNADGVQEVIEAVFEPYLDDYVPTQDLTELSTAMPHISQRTRTYHDYAVATLRDIVGFRLDQASILEANTLSHMIFLNRLDVAGPGSIGSAESAAAPFEAIPLPDIAQIAPAFSPLVADFNGDSMDDLFLSQNFFATSMQVPRQDAGRGLLLLGDGHGGFEPLASMQSGIEVYGEQRGAAAADFDGDGRMDLVVTQHGAAIMLYRNESAEPGIRVRLAGKAGNPEGLGAIVRLRYPDGPDGPARLVSAGAGYWSQNSSSILLAPDPFRTPSEIVVRWPGGVESSHALPTDNAYLEIRIQHPDNIAQQPAEGAYSSRTSIN